MQLECLVFTWAVLVLFAKGSCFSLLAAMALLSLLCCFVLALLCWTRYQTHSTLLDDSLRLLCCFIAGED